MVEEIKQKIVNEKKIEYNRAYEARGVIARINKIGDMSVGPMVALPVYQFLSLDCGPGRDKILVEFVGPAPYDEITQELDLNKVKEGDIVVNPGLLYRKRAWTQKLMTEHLFQLRKYKPQVIIKSEVDREAPKGEIIIDPNNISKQ